MRGALAVGGALLAASLLSPTGAAAQDESGGFLEVFGGSFRLDGSCVSWEGGECLGGFPEGDDTVYKGLRIGYRSAGRWAVELAIARDTAGDGAVPDQQDPAGLSPPPLETIGVIDVDLWTVGGTYSILRRGPLDLYAGAGAGRITFDGGGDFRMRDLVTVVAGGALVHLWRIVFLRGDVRGYTQWCSEERFRDGFVCDDGPMLGHLPASAGVQLVFHPYDLR